MSIAPYELPHVRASPGDCAAGFAQATRKIRDTPRSPSRRSVVRTGTESGSRSCSMVLLTMLAPPSQEPHGSRTRATARRRIRNSQIADGYCTGSSARHAVAVGDCELAASAARSIWSLSVCLSVLRLEIRDTIVGFHDATRLATLHNSAMTILSYLILSIFSEFPSLPPLLSRFWDLMYGEMMLGLPQGRHGWGGRGEVHGWSLRQSSGRWRVLVVVPSGTRCPTSQLWTGGPFSLLQPCCCCCCCCPCV